MTGNLTTESLQNHGGPKVCPTGLEVFPSIYTHCPTHKVELTQQNQDALIGVVLGSRYEITETVSWGGWASIYRGIDIKTDLEVAVKVLHSHLSNDGEAVSRFSREGKAAANLSHPNLSRVYDAGVLPDGQPYIVMEFVSGITLAERLATLGPLTAEQMIPVFVQAADGLEAAHESSIIHRDIKPSNLMLSHNEAGELQAKLVDFGLARAMDNSGLDFAQITRTGQTLGSPAYMSPEQCLGNKLDARSDIYALGCTMYEALSGHPPFVANSILEYMHKHTYEAPEPLEVRSAEANFGYNIGHVIMQALSKNPDDRQQSMGQLRDQLQACLWRTSDDSAVAAEPTTPPNAAPPPAVAPKKAKTPNRLLLRLHGVTSTFAPVVMCLILIGFLVYVLRGQPAPDQPGHASAVSHPPASAKAASAHHEGTHKHGRTAAKRT